MDANGGLSLNIPSTNKPRVVIIGAGFGGVYAIKALKSRDFQVVVFDERNYHTFQPLLYQVATAGLQPDAIAGPLRKIVSRKQDFHFRMLKVQSIHPDEHKVFTPAGELHYDYLIIANGMKTNYFGNDQIKEHALPLKWIPDALNLRSQLLELFEWAGLTTDPAQRKKIMTIVLVGGGPTGVEMAGALSELRKYILPKDYPALDFSEMKIYLVEGLPRLIPAMSEKASERSKSDLEKMGIVIKLNTMVESYDGKTVVLKNGERINTFTVIWSAGVSGNIIEGLSKSWVEKNRLLTDEYCRVKGSNNIFAVGDIALMKTDDYPKGHPGLAQPAIQMGKYVGRHLHDLHLQKEVPVFHYKDKGSLATIGRGKAVADLGKLRFGGRPAWWIWLVVHIMFLVSFRNRLLVFVNWVWNYFTFDKANRLIIRPLIKKEMEVSKTLSVVQEKE